MKYTLNNQHKTGIIMYNAHNYAKLNNGHPVKQQI